VRLQTLPLPKLAAVMIPYLPEPSKESSASKAGGFVSGLLDSNS
jgi:hypothetical protein